MPGVEGTAVSVVAEALGFHASDFKNRKGGMEWAGKCLIHSAKKN